MLTGVHEKSTYFSSLLIRASTWSDKNNDCINNTNIGHFQCICALKQNTVHRANVLTTPVCTCYLQYTMTLCQTSDFFLKHWLCMQKVEFLLYKRNYSFYSFWQCVVCLHCLFPRVDFPAYIKVSDNKKIKVTQWTTLFFSPLSSVFVRAHRYSQRTRQAKKQKDF